MASGLIQELSLEQTEPYRREFERKEIYKAGCAAINSSPLNTHAALGPTAYTTSTISVANTAGDTNPRWSGAAKFLVHFMSGYFSPGVFPSASENTPIDFGLHRPPSQCPWYPHRSDHPDVVAGVFALIALIQIADAEMSKHPVITVSIIAFLPATNQIWRIVLVLAVMFFYKVAFRT